MAAPFGPLRYLYVGCKDTAKDVAYHRDVLGAAIVWDIQEPGAHVAAVRLGPGPLILLADHRPSGSVICLFEVADLRESMARLSARGWKPDGPAFELPEGPCATFRDPSGNEFGVMQFTRPGVFGQEDVGPEPAPSRGGRAARRKK